MKKTTLILGTLCLAFAVVSCQKDQKGEDHQGTLSGLDPRDFASVIQGDSTRLYTLVNNAGAEATVTNYGGRITSLLVPDRDGKLQDVILGYDNIDDFTATDNNFGAMIGRYGNRINQGRFSIDGVEYQLPQNNYGHCLHGGPNGFHTRVFDCEQLSPGKVRLTYRSPDGEEGFPGNLDVEIIVSLLDDNSLDLVYKATTDKPTIVNLTNHSYFNLSGDGSRSILDHVMMINADGFTPVDSTFMTNGTIEQVEGTPMDFRTPTAVGERIEQYNYAQLKNTNGYDHNYVLNTKGDISQVACTVYAPSTGIMMSIYTTEPGIQVYSGNFLNGMDIGKRGEVYHQRNALALETQKYPNSPNVPDWPSPRLNPGETYTSHTIYRFSTTE